MVAISVGGADFTNDPMNVKLFHGFAQIPLVVDVLLKVACSEWLSLT